jgi:hypothetical protein
VHIRLLVSVLLVCVGCSSKPVPPVIERIDQPPSVALSADGVYPLALAITFHDDDDVVTVVRFTVPVGGKSYDTPVSELQQQFRGVIQATLRFPGTQPKGALSFQVTLIDASGLASIPSSQQVTIE